MADTIENLKKSNETLKLKCAELGKDKLKLDALYKIVVNLEGGDGGDSDWHEFFYYQTQEHKDLLVNAGFKGHWA